MSAGTTQNHKSLHFGITSVQSKADLAARMYIQKKCIHKDIHEHFHEAFIFVLNLLY